jgi:hypothetical protein
MSARRSTGSRKRRKEAEEGISHRVSVSHSHDVASDIRGGNYECVKTDRRRLEGRPIGLTAYTTCKARKPVGAGV